MLIELAVRDLGVIADLRLTFEAQMSALTGETGAGKTMLVEALGLLLGAKADPSRVRPGAAESVVEGRFVRSDDTEVVLRRVVPATGRSRCYIDGDMATVAALAEVGTSLVEICGQHSQQRLQSSRSQREALDRFAGIDLGPLTDAIATRRDLETRLGALGGDDRTRAREIDLLRFQLDELDRAGIEDPDEDDALSREEDVLADAIAHLEAGAAAMGALHDDGGASDRLGEALAAIAHRRPFEAVAGRLAGVIAELTDAVDELRSTIESIEPDPQRLDVIRSRRQLFVDLRRKYGDSLAEVMAYHREVAERLEELTSHDERAAALDAELARAIEDEHAERAKVHAARRAAAPALAEAIEGHLREVALPNARVEIAVDGDDVEFRMSTNPGMEPQPIAKAASGGELSRTMLAMYQVLSTGAPTMVFDEVDAGIGGTAATAVGRALARLGHERQILVVTHLPQVAAHAAAQLSVEKSGETLALTTIRTLDDDERVIELSRMLSGTPDSDAARTHAAELLANAQGSTR